MESFRQCAGDFAFRGGERARRRKAATRQREVKRATEIFKWINFAIVAGLVAWVFLKLTPPFFRKNAETISSAITKATAAKAGSGTVLRKRNKSWRVWSRKWQNCE